MSINVFAGSRKALVASIALAAVLGSVTASSTVFAADALSAASTTVTLSAKINGFTNTDWLNGVWRAAPALSIPASTANNAAFKVGASVRLADGQVRKVTKVYVVGSNLSACFSMARLSTVTRWGRLEQRERGDLHHHRVDHQLDDDPHQRDFDHCFERHHLRLQYQQLHQYRLAQWRMAQVGRFLHSGN
ncbi:hypothetical protein SSTU70S_00058 [Stutzerimonas stutzeri]